MDLAALPGLGGTDRSFLFHILIAVEHKPLSIQEKLGLVPVMEGSAVQSPVVGTTSSRMPSDQPSLAEWVESLVSLADGSGVCLISAPTAISERLNGLGCKVRESDSISFTSVPSMVAEMVVVVWLDQDQATVENPGSWFRDWRESGASAVVVVAPEVVSLVEPYETRDRSWWLRLAFESGFRRLRSGWPVAPRNDLFSLAVEPVSAETLRRYPIDRLRRQLGASDALRDVSPEAEAILQRYRFVARQWDQPERILDLGCGCGFGTRILTDDSQAREGVGLDAEEAAVAYSRMNYATANAKTWFEVADANDLTRFTTGSFSGAHVASTVTSKLEGGRLLSELHRVLRPGANAFLNVDAKGHSGERSNDLLKRIILRAGRFFQLGEVYAQVARDDQFQIVRLRNRTMPSSLPVESFLVELKRVDLTQRSLDRGVVLVRDLTQVMTAGALLLGRDARLSDWEVFVVDTQSSEARMDAVALICRAAGLSFGGQLHLEIDLDDLAAGARTASIDAASTSLRLLSGYPILCGLERRPTVLAPQAEGSQDYAWVAALNPKELTVMVPGTIADTPIRNHSESDRLPVNALSELPGSLEIWAPSHLMRDAAMLGEPKTIEESAFQETCRRILDTDPARAVFNKINSLELSLRSVIIGESLRSLIPEETEIRYYRHLLRRLRAEGWCPLLYKAHPDDSAEKLQALKRALPKNDLVITEGPEASLPIEPMGEALAAHGVVVLGQAIASMLSLAAWPGIEACCVDASYLPRDLRRPTLEFAVRYNLPLVRLALDDEVLLPEDERALHEYVAKRNTIGPEKPSADARALKLASFYRSLLRAGNRPVILWSEGDAGKQAWRALSDCYREPTEIIDGRGASAESCRQKSPAVLVVGTKNANRIRRQLIQAGWPGDDVLVYPEE